MTSNDRRAPEHTLITGASAGIGWEMAHVFARNGHDLTLVARRKTRLEKLARDLHRRYGVQVSALPADLADAGAPQAIFDAMQERDTGVDILVNNAGVLFGGGFRRMKPDDIAAMINLNILALTVLCRLFVEPMVDRGQGRIVNVASLAAFQPVPSLAVYAATKAYVLSMSEALAEEIKSKGVSVTTVCPGFTDTDMMRTPAGEPPKLPAAVIMKPEQVAAEAYRACMNGDVIKVTGLTNALAASGIRLMPRWLVRNLSGFLARGGR